MELAKMSFIKVFREVYPAGKGLNPHPKFLSQPLGTWELVA